ncbi:hypothetical protein B0H12DRAFT_1327032 [Mycena haematopus]|nr:hypothetical protein B0H12DRAFT_1327032 [Mycena haematopus]
MEPIRQPLRNRCNVYLRVCTDSVPTSTKSKLPANLVSSAGNTPPVHLEDRLPRVTSPPPLPTSPYVVVDLEEPRPRQFIPYLYLSDSPPSPSTQLPQGNWTHVLRILPASKDHPAGSTDIGEPIGSALQVLDLYTPAVPPSSKVLHLNKRHVLVARDFLALALPYYASAHPTEDAIAEAEADSSSDVDPFLLSSSSTMPPPAQRCRADAVRVLLMGPPRAILAVALTYIAYASECTVAHVMRCVMEDGEDEESCELIGTDARMGLGASQMQVLEELAQKGL